MAVACTDLDGPHSYKPALGVQPATDVECTQATLRAIVELRDRTEMPEVTFRYGRTPALDQEADTTRREAGDTLVARLEGLVPGATYYWCAVATNGRARITSDTLQFTTMPYTHVLGIQPPTDVERTQATLRATIRQKDKAETPEVTFHYGTTPALDQEAAATPREAGDTLVARLEGLVPGTTYYWCAVASNGRVRLVSDTLQFTTMPNTAPHTLPIELLSAGPTSMIVGLTIPDNGGEPLTGAGCYLKETQSGKVQRIEAQSINESTQLRLRISHLQANHTYEVWGYAANAVGESLTDTLTYTTSSSITLTEPGQFADLMKDDICSLKEISISGPLNGDDLGCLRAMMGRDSEGNDTGGRLVRADLTDVFITRGGGAYDQGHFTEHNVVGTGMFAGLDRLLQVKLPSTATRIAENAFTGCTALREITIPASVSEVGQSSGCTALERITVDKANQHFMSADGVLLDAKGSSVLWFPMGKRGDYTLPATVTSIGDYAFRQCSITRFTLPDGLKQMGKGAFSHSLVEEVTMPGSLVTLPTGTFQDCTRLKSVHLGSGLELVSDHAFDGCTLEHLYIDNPLPPYCNSKAFTPTGTPFTETCYLHVPQGCKLRYRSSPGWKEFVHVRETP